MSDKKQFKYGQSLIEYQLISEDRKNLAITVQPDKSVLIKAPLKSKLEEIECKLKKRGKWILQQINYFDKFHPLQPESEYVSGETHFYLGRQYRLRVRKSSGESVKLISKFFYVDTNNPSDKKRVQSLMNQWYADHAKLQIDRRAKEFVEQILGSGYAEIPITYNFLKKRWGVYNPDRSITINIELIKTPIQCVDYVIVHELCHVVHPNHDKAFYILMESILPDWRIRKDKLELFGVR